MLKHSEIANLPIIESCEGCGACCMQTPVPPFVVIDGQHEAKLRNVPEGLIAEIMPSWEIRFNLQENPCMWFDPETLACQHYEHRPQACRDFEINCSSCHSIRDRCGIGS
ncbi:YkgJ family cysteine cluster protein [Thalassoglobus polymorphus]|nr:YkgJ family cysteine cluster protein [Thalassoglobus polymorphus]